MRYICRKKTIMENLDTPLDDLRFDSMEQIEYASFAERLAARIIDTFVILIPSIFIPIVPSWLYFAFMESSEGQATVGKKAMGIMVTDLHGNRISFGQASGRFFGNFVSTMIIFIGYLMMFASPKGQCLHDMMAGTVVVRRRSYSNMRQQQRPQTSAQSGTAKSWELRNAPDDFVIVKVDETGVQFFHRTPVGDVRESYTLQELAQGSVDFSDSLGAEKADDVKAFSRDVLNYLRQKGMA